MRGMTFKYFAEAPPRHQPLAQAQGKSGCSRQRAVRLNIVLRKHLFQPQWLIWLQGLGDPNGARQIPKAMKLHGNVHRITEFVANLPQRTEPLPHLIRRNVVSVVLASYGIERPDFHGGNSAVQQFLRQPDRLRQKIHVIIASVVNPNGGAGGATQQLVNRRAQRFPGNIPEGYIQSADGSNLGTRPAAGGHRLEHIGP